MNTTYRREFDPVDVSSIKFWSQSPEKWEPTFRELRDHRPISWHPSPEESLVAGAEDDGFWAVVRHADIVSVSTRPELFCSERGAQFEELPPEVLRATQSIVAMDGPRHVKVRNVVSAAFSPIRLASMTERMVAEARRVVANFAEAGECDFVEYVSVPIARWTMMDLLGMPQEMLDEFTRLISLMLSSRDEEARSGIDRATIVDDVITKMTNMTFELACARRAQPREDLMTDLVQARVDGEPLDDSEISAFFLLLVGAGFDTPRQTISHAAKALSDFPAQRALLREDFDARIPAAIDELLRWATPVLNLRRTATRDVELNGVPIREGDKVALFYPSGNRDERAFRDPHTLDLTRTPNKHLSFGGGGPHRCVGSVLAKIELRVILRELVLSAPDFHLGEPTRLTSNFISAIPSMPATAGPLR